MANDKSCALVKAKFSYYERELTVGPCYFDLHVYSNCTKILMEESIYYQPFLLKVVYLGL